MTLLSIYGTKNKPRLRAKFKIQGKEKVVWCGKQLPELSPSAYVSMVSKEEGNSFVEITHESGVTRWTMK